MFPYRPLIGHSFHTHIYVYEVFCTYIAAHDINVTYQTFFFLGHGHILCFIMDLHLAAVCFVYYYGYYLYKGFIVYDRSCVKKHYLMLACMACEILLKFH